MQLKRILKIFGNYKLWIEAGEASIYKCHVCNDAFRVEKWVSRDDVIIWEEENQVDRKAIPQNSEKKWEQ